MLINDREITISSAGSRRAAVWTPQKLFVSEFYGKLRIPVRSPESLAEYLSYPKSKQDNLKDVGGFIAGTLEGNKRKAGSVIGRDVVTLDLDNVQPGGTNDVLCRIDGLGCSAAVYSTRKHEEARPRLRVLIPLDKTVTADEYEPIARKLGQIIGIELCDPTTFQASRLMYFPSCCNDSQYVFQYWDKPFISADGVLDKYTNWRDINEWPKVPGEKQNHQKLAARQEDPTTKTGVIGAFCKTYDVYRAMETFIPGIYEPCDDNSNRFTFTGGSTVGGAVVYENGNFLYSHHATDPIGDKLCNAFDLVRLHKFGEMDDDAKPDTPVNKMPSYKAMCEFAVSDPFVATLINQERYEKTTEAFSQPLEESEGDIANWISKLALNSSSGAPLKTTANVRVVLENDPLLRDRVRKDTFADHILGEAPLPWGLREKENGIFLWTDDDDSGLREYIEKILGFRSRDIIDDGLRNHSTANSFNSVVDYLNGLEWDGVSRLDTLYIDYLGAEDCAYMRTITRKAFVAAVARVMTPGCKFDYMTIVCGRQGIGKSTLFSKLGGKWFSDSIKTFEGKDAAELLQGIWIVEIGELEAFNKSDIKAVKQFLSKCDDQYRAAYARKTEKHLRQCVFFGTTNSHEYLSDPTGNRRFWPVDTEIQKPTKKVFGNLDDEVDQIWAEAVLRWRLGEPLILSPEMEQEAEKRRTTHLERDPLQGQIEAFLDRQIPQDWQKWSMERRRMFWGNGITDTLELVKRDRVCALEIWKECLGEIRNMSKAESHRINSILEVLPGWDRVGTIRFGANYGRQRGFRPINIIKN